MGSIPEELTGFPSPAQPFPWLPLSEGPSLTVEWQRPPRPSSCRHSGFSGV